MATRETPPMMLAMFPDEAALSRALRQLGQARIGPLETYTPAPLEDAAHGSPIPALVLLAGMLATALSFGLQVYSAMIAYDFDVGGRPTFAWASFIPTAFENGVLAAIAAGFIGFFAINRMPRLYDPVDESASMRRASRDRWFVQVATDEASVMARARQVLGELHPILIEELPS